MAIVVVKNKLTKKEIVAASENLLDYIKLTIDLVQELIAIGGKFHADAERILLEQHNSQQDNIWGGGYDTKLKRLETNAVLNIRGGKNNSMEILDPTKRKKFLELAGKIVEEVEKLK